MKRQGFSLIEAVFVMALIGIAFFGFGFLFGNIDQQALKADLTIMATKLAKDEMERVIQVKADSGYAAVQSIASAPVTNGAWTFTRHVDTSWVNPADMANSGAETGYKRVDIVVSWGAAAGESITLTTLVTNMVPSAVVGPSYPACP